MLQVCVCGWLGRCASVSVRARISDNHHQMSSAFDDRPCNSDCTWTLSFNYSCYALQLLFLLHCHCCRALILQLQSWLQERLMRGTLVDRVGLSCYLCDVHCENDTRSLSAAGLIEENRWNGSTHASTTRHGWSRCRRSQAAASRAGLPSLPGFLLP